MIGQCYDKIKVFKETSIISQEEFYLESLILEISTKLETLKSDSNSNLVPHMNDFIGVFS
jgi:hypothetical protein